MESPNLSPSTEVQNITKILQSPNKKMQRITEDPRKLAGQFAIPQKNSGKNRSHLSAGHGAHLFGDFGAFPGHGMPCLDEDVILMLVVMKALQA